MALESIYICDERTGRIGSASGVERLYRLLNLDSETSRVTDNVGESRASVNPG
jgi:hypothetical protein